MVLRGLFLLLLLVQFSAEGTAKEGGKPKKGKKGKQVICPSQLSAEDLDRVPANSTSNILNRLLVTYDSRIRPNFKGYYTCVEVIFTLRRQVGFYMMGVYAPTLLIVVLSWLSFWINPDASAARVPLGSTSPFLLPLISSSVHSKDECCSEVFCLFCHCRLSVRLWRLNCQRFHM
ncbi:hypothetical protein MHYP_G00249590 [Metynnis hypsauchen]